jgi:hypothetical protein
MTGPEHYAEAQNLLRLARGTAGNNERDALLGCAQVHATLALAAATARPAIAAYLGPDSRLDDGDWSAAVSS